MHNLSTAVDRVHEIIRISAVSPFGAALTVTVTVSGRGGTASDIEIQAREIIYLRSNVNRLMAKHTGRPVEQIERDFDRDHFMSAEEAKAYGIIDNVITHRGELVEASQQPTVTA